MRLKDKRVLVTGAASGIGAAVAQDCALQGARVIAFDIHPCPDVDEYHAVDVTDEDAVQQALKKVSSLDAVVNAAGIARRSTVDIADVSAWDDVMCVNVRGTFVVSKHAVPLLQKNAGSIVHIASVVGMMGIRNRSAYSASKGAIIALTRNMAMDYAHQNIRVNCVCPGFTQTPMTKGIFEDPSRLAAVTALHPLGRLGTPTDISRAVLFLISEDASWITGQILAVDGGMTAGRADDI